jgi:hypothetical protein
MPPLRQQMGCAGTDTAGLESTQQIKDSL